jgi:N,N'-diacetyllegionaminate synthase
MKTRTLIIAEAGVNHNGDMGMAKSLIEQAAKAGADIVKFQTFNADRLVTRTATKADYQNLTTDKQESQHGMLRRLELTREMHDELISHCKQHEIQFLSTAFDIESIDLLDSLGQTMFKIPSGEITNLPYLRHIARLKRSVILSTGMASLGDIEAALDALERAGTFRSQVTLLHCTTEYPTPMAEVNLRAMQTLKDAFGVSVGYSDHSIGLEVATAAVALGASVIEKHFTLDQRLPGPDHQASLEPDALKAMISAIRNVEVALGDGIKRATISESKNMTVMRKSLVACQPIRTGESFTDKNMTAKRPGTGLSPMRWDEAIERRATRDFAVDELLEF